MDYIYFGCEDGLFREGVEHLFRSAFKDNGLVWVRNCDSLEESFAAKPPVVFIIDPATFIFPYYHRQDGSKACKSAEGIDGRGSKNCRDPEYSPLPYIRQYAPKLPLMAIARGKGAASIGPLVAMGYDGYLFLNKPFSEAVYAVEAVIRGALYFPVEAADSLLSGYSATSYSLTPREREVLALISEGMSSKEIAFSLSIAVSTVEVHRKRLMMKTGSNSVVGLVRFAIKTGLVPL